MLRPSVIRRIHSWALDTPAHYRYSLTTLLAIVLAYGLISGYLNVTGSLLARYNKHIDAAQKEQLVQLTMRNESIKLRTELTQLQEQLDSHHRRMTLGTKDHLLHILDAARTAQVTLGSCGPVRETPLGWRTKKTIQTTARGSMPQIIQFFSALQTGDTPMKCHTMSLTHQSDGVFSLSCSLSTFSLDVKNPST